MFIRRLVTELERAGVDYCIVGGVAVNLYGIPRMTYDVDIVARLTRENLLRLSTVLESLGLRARLPVRLEDLVDPALRRTYLEQRNLVAFTFTDPNNPLHEVDVLVSPPIDVEAALEKPQTLDLDGVPVRVVALQRLLELKRAAGRAQDLADVEQLETFLKDRE